MHISLFPCVKLHRTSHSTLLPLSYAAVLALLPLPCFLQDVRSTTICRCSSSRPVAAHRREVVDHHVDNEDQAERIIFESIQALKVELPLQDSRINSLERRKLHVYRSPQFIIQATPGTAVIPLPVSTQPVPVPFAIDPAQLRYWVAHNARIVDVSLLVVRGGPNGNPGQYVELDIHFNQAANGLPPTFSIVGCQAVDVRVTYVVKVLYEADE